MPNFTFYGRRNQATMKFYFSFWAWVWSLEIQLREGLPTIWESKWVGIIVIKTEKTQIHFLSDVLVTIASLDLKVPNVASLAFLNNYIFLSSFFMCCKLLWSLIIIADVSIQKYTDLYFNLYVQIYKHGAQVGDICKSSTVKVLPRTFSDICSCPYTSLFHWVYYQWEIWWYCQESCYILHY